MVISVSETFTHSSPCRVDSQKEEDIQKQILKLMKKNGINPKKANWTEDGRLELGDASQLKLHRLMLQAEELGLDLKMTKQTHIEIC